MPLARPARPHVCPILAPNLKTKKRRKKQNWCTVNVLEGGGTGDIILVDDVKSEGESSKVTYISRNHGVRALT